MNLELCPAGFLPAANMCLHERPSHYFGATLSTALLHAPLFLRFIVGNDSTILRWSGNSRMSHSSAPEHPEHPEHLRPTLLSFLPYLRRPVIYVPVHHTCAVSLERAIFLI